MDKNRKYMELLKDTLKECGHEYSFRFNEDPIQGRAYFVQSCEWWLNQFYDRVKKDPDEFERIINLMTKFWDEASPELRAGNMDDAMHAIIHLRIEFGAYTGFKIYEDAPLPVEVDTEEELEAKESHYKHWRDEWCDELIHMVEEDEKEK